MNCLSCNSKMKIVVISGVEIDVCMNCGGIWFDNFELKKLDEKTEGKGEILNKLLSFERKTDTNEKRICPKCKIKLKEHEYSVNTNIFIDECYGCGGIWLDSGELKAIRENFKSDEDRENIVENMLNQNSDFKEVASKRKELNEAYNSRKKLINSLLNW